jgi:predicted outer membrane protein
LVTAGDSCAASDECRIHYGDFDEGGVMKQLTNQSTGKQLLMVAALKGLSAAPAADSALVGKLQTLKGKELDQAYVEQVTLEGHQKAVDLFQKESGSGTDTQLKAAAAHALPTIKHHLAMAQQLAGAMKIMNASYRRG